MKLFIWYDTVTFAGSAFHGTLFAMAEDVETARNHIRKLVEEYYQDVKTVDSRFELGIDTICFYNEPKQTYRDVLENDLKEEPLSDVLCGYADGGDL